MAESYVCVEIDSNKTISVLDKLPNGQTLDNYSKFDDVVNDNNIQKSKYIAIKIMKGQCSQPNNCFQFAGIEYEMMLDNLPNDISALNPIDDAFLSSKQIRSSAANTNVTSSNVTSSNVTSSNVTSSNVVSNPSTNVTSTKSNGGRRGVPNVGNSCWANGVYQMLYDAEDFRKIIIDGTWKEGFFTTNSDKLTGSVQELTAEEKARKAELEQQVNLTEDEQKEHDKLNLKQDTSNWSWVPKNMTPEEYKDIFGSLLQKIFKYIRGDDIKITYETSLIPVLLFPDNNNRQQDSREFIQQLRTKTDEGLSADSKNLLNIDTYFGFQQQDGKRYYIDNGQDTEIQLSDPIKIPTTMIELPLDKNETNVQDLANLYARGTVDDFDVEGIKDEEWKKIIGLNSGSEDKMNEIKARGKVPVYFNTNQEYSDFSKYLLVTLTREAVNGGQREKNTTKVAFDDKLEIKGNNFTLFGVVVHAGTGTDSGHYVYESIIGNQEYNDSTNNELYSSYKKDYVEKNWTILLFKNDTATSEAKNVAEEEENVAKVESAEVKPENVAKVESAVVKPENVAEVESAVVKPENVAKVESAVVKPENVAEVEYKNVTEVESKNVTEVESKNVAEVKPENVAEVKPENVAEVKPENVAEVKPENVAEVKTENEIPKTIFKWGPQQGPRGPPPQGPPRSYLIAVEKAKQEAEKERLAKEQAERDRLAKEQAEKATKEAAEKAAREQAEKATKEAAEKTAKEQAERERLAKEQAEKATKEAAEKATKEAAEKATKEQAEKATKEQAEKATKEQAEKATKEAAEKAAKEQAERDRLAKEQAEKAKQEPFNTKYKIPVPKFGNSTGNQGNGSQERFVAKKTSTPLQDKANAIRAEYASRKNKGGSLKRKNKKTKRKYYVYNK